MKYVFLVDVNSAFLSWSAAHMLVQGYSIDIRDIPSAIGGNQDSRHGIILAKSVPAKKFGVMTGESIQDAKQKCPQLRLYPPNYYLYSKASKAMIEILYEYSPMVQQFSIDEAFMAFNLKGTKYKDPVDLAKVIQLRIFSELGFTVNIGISTNKILAKMAAGLKKPNMIHTIYTHEIEEKLWPLKVRDLFMVGAQTEKKLKNLGLNTIKDIAVADPKMLYQHFKSYAILLQSYACGVDNSPVLMSRNISAKGVGNGTTIPFDVTDARTAHLTLLSLVESVAMRLRGLNSSTGLIAVHITYSDFSSCSHQKKLTIACNSTTYLYYKVIELFNELWDINKRIRKLRVRASELCNDDYIQLSYLETFDFITNSKIDATVDEIRFRYGMKSIIRSCFLHSGLSPITGGIGKEDYPVMSSYL